MKTRLFTVIILFLGLGVTQKSFSIARDSSEEEFTFTNHQIRYEGKFLGKFDITSSESYSNKEKTRVYNVKIFDESGNEIARYEIQFAGLTKRNTKTILDASLKTAKDNVNHNAGNFLDFSSTANSNDADEPQVVQFDRVVKYLIHYNYF
ncbi:hypothetical protein N9R54_03160 [Pelobium sp.]|nr:hypothetical protein [Pelobium sp.]MDA9555216.1 hypothetical protein [Pelobium sp.]